MAACSPTRIANNFVIIESSINRPSLGRLSGKFHHWPVSTIQPRLLVVRLDNLGDFAVRGEACRFACSSVVNLDQVAKGKECQDDG